MKIRNSFVSNSSSTSFVLIGFKLEEKVNYRNFLTAALKVPEEEVVGKDFDTLLEMFFDKMDNSEFWVLCGKEMGSPRDDQTIFGKPLASTIEEMAETIVVSFKEEKEKLKKIQELLECKTPIKLYIGNQLS